MSNLFDFFGMANQPDNSIIRVTLENQENKYRNIQIPQEFEKPRIISPKKIYACINCNLNFTGTESLNKHLRRHINSDEACPICHEIQRTEEEMQLHLEKHQSGDF